MVVDDSVVIRRLVTHALEQDPLLDVVGAASNGAIALQRIPQFNPDVLTLDIEMPEMDGLEMLRHVRREYPRLRVIMFSTLTERGAAITLEALTLGADDYVTKASNEGSLDRSMARLREELVPKIKQFFHVSGQTAAAAALPLRPVPATPPAWRSTPPRRRRGCGRRSSRLESPPEGRQRWAPSCRSCRAGSHCPCWSSSTCRRCSPDCSPSGLMRSADLPVQEAKQGDAGGSGKDPDCARRLPSEGRFQRRRNPSAVWISRRRRTPAVPPSTRCLLRSARCMAARSSP